MRCLLFLTAFCVLLPARAQEQLGNDGALAQAVAYSKALGDAKEDALRDSLSLSLKSSVRAVLEQDDAMTIDLGSLPLSRVEAPDGTFRLITWNVPHSDGSHAYEGMLLVQEKRRRVVYELRDMTPKITGPENRELGPDNWYGALYYGVVQTTKGGKTYYTLLGWKGHSTTETRKVIDVLGFRRGVPRFGAPLFGSGKLKQHRVVFGYAFQVTMALRLEADEQRIVFDHLSPSRPDLEGQPAFYGPDLSYDAYRWDKDHWEFERDIDARMKDKGKPYNPPPKDQRR